MSAALSIQGVSHAFGALDVLRDVSLAVGANELVALIGPSGCGKSTLLQIAGGLLRPDRGRITMAPAPRDSLNPLTFVFQDFALLPWRSVAGNVAFALEHHALAPAERDAIVTDVLARTGLSDFRDALPQQLSGGMRQRVGIARALAVRPSVMLMDEPFSALDSQTRELLIEDLVALLARTKLAALYVTHNVDEALRLADRIVVLSRRPGAIRATITIDTPRETRAMAMLSPVRDEIWSLMREGAIAADRDRVDG